MKTLAFTLGAIWLVKPIIKRTLLGQVVDKHESLILAVVLLLIAFII